LFDVRSSAMEVHWLASASPDVSTFDDLTTGLFYVYGRTSKQSTFLGLEGKLSISFTSSIR
jgi:hypothetical protein